MFFHILSIFHRLFGKSTYRTSTILDVTPKYRVVGFRFDTDNGKDGTSTKQELHEETDPLKKSTDLSSMLV